MTKRKNHEEDTQIALMNWAKYKMLPNGKTIFELMIHIRNESYEKGKPYQIANRMKRAKLGGFKSGIPDLFFAYPINGKHGLWLEMKRPHIKGSVKGRLSDNQKKMLAILELAGYECAVCHGWQQAVEVIEDYLK